MPTISRCASCHHFSRAGESRFGSCLHRDNLTQLTTSGELSPANVPDSGSCYRHKPRRNDMSKSTTYLVRVFAEGSRDVMRKLVRELGHPFFSDSDGAIHPASHLNSDEALDASWAEWEHHTDGDIPTDVTSVVFVLDTRVRSDDGARALAHICNRLATSHNGVQFTAYGFPTSRGRGAADFSAIPVAVSCEIGGNPESVAPLFRSGPL